MGLGSSIASEAVTGCLGMQSRGVCSETNMTRSADIRLVVDTLEKEWRMNLFWL